MSNIVERMILMQNLKYQKIAIYSTPILNEKSNPPAMLRRMEYKNVEIVAGAVCIDHVHLRVAIPLKLSVLNFMGYLKGKSTLMLYDRHPELQSKCDKAFWARGYYVETIGNITDEAAQKYIKEQAKESRREDSQSAVLQRTSKNARDTASCGEQ